MARTKQTTKISSGKAVKKQLKTKAGRKSSMTQSQQASGKRRYRFRPGANALREIYRYQKSTDNLIKKAPFMRVVRNISKSINSDIMFKQVAITALQESVENFIVKLCEDSKLVATHAKRITLMAKDLKLIKKIKHEDLFGVQV